MRQIFVILFIALASKSLASVPEIQITDKSFLRAIDIYLDTMNLSDSDPGVLLVEISNMERNHTFENSRKPFYDIVVRGATSEFQLTTPSAYFMYRNRPILIYTGIEKLMVNSDDELKRLIKKVKYKLGPTGMLRSIPPVWFHIEKEVVTLLRG
jgi:hypothetical protein